MRTKNLLILGYCILMHSPSFLQSSEMKKDKSFIRNYKAPDYKVKQLNFNFSSNGYSGRDGTWSNGIYGGVDVTYSQYSNTKRYQGSLSTNLRTSYGYSKGSNEERSNALLTPNIISLNRFFISDNFFVGAFSDFNSSVVRNAISTAPSPYVNIAFSASPAATIGWGRMEPVRFARKAMDIEKSLKKAGRLKRDFTQTELTKLANRIAQINNVRFYDRRLRLIEQYEELDNALSELNIVTDKDMRYFSHLSDAYLYAQNYNRFSGIINEFGLTQTLSFAEEVSNNMILSREAGSYAFYNFQLSIPKSYSIQHDYQASLLGGYRNRLVGQDDGDFPIWLNLSYSLGIHPNTRTSFKLTSELGTSYDNNFGVSGRLRGAFYYYISPRVRLNAEAAIGIRDNYERHNIFILSDGVPIVNSSEVLSTSFNLSFSYAIF